MLPTRRFPLRPRQIDAELSTGLKAPERVLKDEQRGRPVRRQATSPPAVVLRYGSAVQLTGAQLEARHGAQPVIQRAYRIYCLDF